MKCRLSILISCAMHALTIDSFVAVALAIILTGCTRNFEPGIPDVGKVEITFSTIATSVSTRAVDNEPLEEGTSFRVMVYEVNADPATAIPVATGVYTVIDAAGTASPQTVDDRIFLYTKQYDFYFIAPTAEPSAGKVTAESCDEVLTTGKQTVTIAPDVSGQCAVSVAFTRHSAMLDIVVYYKDSDPMMTSLAIPADKTLSVWGLFSSADVPLDGTPFTPRGIWEGENLREINSHRFPLPKETTQ